jgi:hypothetical protein
MRRGGAAAISSSTECAVIRANESMMMGELRAEPCPRGHSFVTGARCDPRAAQRAALSQRMTGGYMKCRYLMLIRANH